MELPIILMMVLDLLIQYWQKIKMQRCFGTFAIQDPTNESRKEMNMQNKWKQLTRQWMPFKDQMMNMWNEVTAMTSRGSSKGIEVNTKTEWNHIAGQWKQFQGKAKKQWGELTDSELLEVNGRYDILAEKIQERYGIEREEANRQIDVWAASLNV